MRPVALGLASICRMCGVNLNVTSGHRVVDLRKMREMVESRANELFGGEEEDLDQDESRPALPVADFDFLIYSLRLQAELNLGLLPFAEQQKPDFELAGHNIDLLVILQEKTKGNLSPEEKRALDNAVTELRYQFVQAKNKAE